MWTNWHNLDASPEVKQRGFLSFIKSYGGVVIKNDETPSKTLLGTLKKQKVYLSYRVVPLNMTEQMGRLSEMHRIVLVEPVLFGGYYYSLS